MKTFDELCKTEVIELANLAVEMQNTNVELVEKLEAANHDYEELMKERTDYVAENKRLQEALAEYKTLTIKNCQRCAKYFGWCDEYQQIESAIDAVKPKKPENNP